MKFSGHPAFALRASRRLDKIAPGDFEQRLEQDVRGAIAVGRLKPIADRARRCQRQARGGHRRAGDSATPARQLLALMGRGGDGARQGETRRLCRAAAARLGAGDGHGLQREHLAPSVRTERNTLRDGVALQDLHRAVRARLQGEVAALLVRHQ